MSSTVKFSSHADSIDISPSNVVVGLSNLEGNIWDGSLKLYSIEASGNVPSRGFSMKEMYTQKCSAGVSMCRFAGNRHEIIIASRDDGNIALYSSDSLDCVAMYCAHDDIVSAIAIDPVDRNQFASCGWDGSIKLWDLATIMDSTNGDKPTTPTLSIGHAHYKHVNDISFCPHNNAFLCSAGQDGFIRLWNLQSSNHRDLECICIYNLHQALSCILWGIDTDYNDNQDLYAGTDAGDVIRVDLKLDNTGTFNIVHKLHSGRIRRLVRVASASTSTQSHRDNVLISASDDATVVASTLATSGSTKSADDFTKPNSSRICVHKDYVTDLSVHCAFTQGGEGNGGNSKFVSLPNSVGHSVNIVSVSSDKTLQVKTLPLESLRMQQ